MDTELHFDRSAVSRTVLTGVITGALAPVVYVLALGVTASLGYWFLPFAHIPIDLGRPWTVAPGAALLGAGLGFCLRFKRMERRPRLLWGATLGALLAPLNVPLSVQVALVAYRFRGGEDSIWSWMSSLPEVVLHSLPVAIPCGALLGVAIGLVCDSGGRVRNRAAHG
jgi:hypothetical protein